MNKMSTYIVLDSIYRDNTDESATNYSITSQQTLDWPDQPRTVNAIPPDIFSTNLDFHSFVEIQDLLVYYDPLLNLTPEPFLKMTFYNLEHNDHFFINTLDENRDVKFFLVLKKTLTDNWYRYKCQTKQLMRLSRKGSFVFKIWDSSNNILTVGDDGRTICSISITPYHMEGQYDNKTQQARRI